jgi:hypothetical protein
VHPLRGHGPGLGFLRYAPDGGGAEDVLCFDEVVGVPLERGGLVGRAGENAGERRGHTMSSGSSGMSTMDPVPSRSTLFLMSRIVLGGFL